MKPRERFEWIILAVLITAGFAAIPPYASAMFRRSLSPIRNLWVDLHVGEPAVQASIGLVVASLLVTAAPLRSGLIVPRLQNVWPRVIGTCVGCVAGGLFIAYQTHTLELRSIDHDHWLWLVGPIGEDLVIAGFLFGKFDSLWPGPLFRWLPVRRTVVLTAVFFALYHALNFQSMNSTRLYTQSAVVFLIAAAVCLTRQWTGSILFVMLTHVAFAFFM